jgi:hypothetical protein
MTQPYDDIPAHGGPAIVDTEPVRVFLASLATVVGLGLVAAEALGWLDIDPNQNAAVIAFVAAVATLVSETLRARVYAPATVERLTEPPPPATPIP